jgi:DNA-binding IclR family transcriptional regulator
MTSLAVDSPEPGCPKSVLGKAQLLLGAFGAGAFRLRLTELSHRSGVPKASAHRLAQELVQWGLLERVGDQYQLGIKVFELGQRVPVSAVLRKVSRPLLVDLFAATRAAIHLAVLEGGHVLYVEKVAGEANVRTHSEVGGRLPATCTATGKILLAVRPESAAVLDRLEKTGLARPTARSAASPSELKVQLAEFRKKGYSVEREETLVGYGSIAVPVRGSGSEVYAAISATLPINRLHVARLVPQLHATAVGITRAVERHTAAARPVAPARTG